MLGGVLGEVGVEGLRGRGGGGGCMKGVFGLYGVGGRLHWLLYGCSFIPNTRLRSMSGFIVCLLAILCQSNEMLGYRQDFCPPPFGLLLVKSDP